METIQQIIGTMDQRLVIGIIIVLGILLVLSLIKKLIHLAVFIMTMILICTFVLPVAKDYQQRYNFRIENNSAMITIDGKDITINKDTCQGIKFNGKSDTSNNYGVSVILDGNTYEFEIPKFIEAGIEKFADSSGILVEAAGLS